MGRRNERPKKKRRRALIGEFLRENPIKDTNDINDFVKELIPQVLENGLDGKIDEDLGYTRYKDILIACVDGLTGFPNAIATVFPKTELSSA